MATKPTVRIIAPGVRLCAMQTNRFKTGCISFSMALPLAGDIAANAVLPYILYRSCRKYPDFSFLNGALADLYGASLSAGLSKIGEAQILSVELTAIDDRFSLKGESISQSCAELLLDLIFDPDLDEDGCFREQAVQREKRLLIERTESELNDKRVFALRRCVEIMCEGEQYGLSKYGSREEIETLTGERVLKAWQNMLSTAVIQIDIAGSGETTGIVDALQKQFATVKRNPVKIETVFVQTAKQSRKVEEKLPVKQGKLVLGFRAGMKNADDNAPALKVMTDIFGGGTYSKLFANVREKMSLCYYCSARLTRHKGLIFVQSGIESEQALPAVDAILEQLNAVKAGEFEEEDLKASKMSMADHLRSIDDSPEALISWYASQILEPQLKIPERESARINAVTKDEVTAAANGITLDTVYMLSETEEAQTDEN